MLQIDRVARGGQASQAESLYRRIPPLLAYEVQSLELLLLGAKRLLRRQGILSNDSLRSPARTLDTHEAETIDRLIDQMAAESVPGFGGVAA
jgi:dihydrodipicolinate synthase/N-acetylneuraminate lyase